MAIPHEQSLDALNAAVTAAKDEFRRSLESAAATYQDVLVAFMRTDQAWSNDPDRAPQSLTALQTARQVFRDAITAATTTRDALIEAAVAQFKASG